MKLPPKKWGLGGAKPPSLGIFGCAVFLVIFPTHDPRFPKGPSSLLAGNKGFPHHFIDTGA